MQLDRICNIIMLLMTLMTLSAVSGGAAAHTRLQAATPAHGAILDHAPDVVRLEFASAPELGLSSVELQTKDGWQPLKITQTGRRITATLPVLHPGRHHLRWSVMSRDGHRQYGKLFFTIR